MATHPVKVVFACILATGLSVIGILRYTTENNAFRLWIPDNSDFVANYNWLEKNSPPDVRFNSMILANQVLIESLKDLDRDSIRRMSTVFSLLPVSPNLPRSTRRSWSSRRGP